MYEKKNVYVLYCILCSSQVPGVSEPKPTVFYLTLYVRGRPAYIDARTTAAVVCMRVYSISVGWSNTYIHIKFKRQIKSRSVGSIISDSKNLNLLLQRLSYRPLKAENNPKDPKEWSTNYL